MDARNYRPHQRLGPISMLPAILAEWGVDPRRVFDGTGLNADECVAERSISYATGRLILERAAAETRCAHIGLHIGTRAGAHAHGPIWRLMRAGENARQALEDFVAWQMINSTGAVVYFRQAGGEAVLGYGVFDRGSVACPHIYDTAVAFGCRLIRELATGRLAPLEIRINRRPPPDAEAYRRLLDAPVRFDSEESCVVLDSGALNVTLPEASPPVRAEIAGGLRAALLDLGAPLSVKVRRATRALVLSGDASRARVGEGLGLHPRALVRGLKAEGATFAGLRDEVCFDLARELLSLTNLPAGAIGMALGYAEHSAFTRAFRRWSGLAPAEWRDREEARRHRASRTKITFSKREI